MEPGILPIAGAYFKRLRLCFQACEYAEFAAIGATDYDVAL